MLDIVASAVCRAASRSIGAPPGYVATNAEPSMMLSSDGHTSYGLRAGRATRVRLRAHGHDPSNTSVALGSSWRHSASVARTAWEQAHAREVFDPGAVSVQVRHP